MHFRTDAIGVKVSEPTSHTINFYYKDKLIHRVFEPAFKRHVFIPIENDWIDLDGEVFVVENRLIKYLPDRIVANVDLKRKIK